MQDSTKDAPAVADLRACFDAEVHRRPSWPREFDLAMADPIVWRLVRLLYVVRLRPRLGAASKPNPRTPPVDLLTPRRGLDLKSRAAGERELEWLDRVGGYQ